MAGPFQGPNINGEYLFYAVICNNGVPGSQPYPMWAPLAAKNYLWSPCRSPYCQPGALAPSPPPMK